MAGRHARPSRRQARHGAYALQRQPLTERAAARRRARLRRSVRATTGGLAGTAGLLAVGVVVTGGTYALWGDTTDLAVGDVDTGTAEIVIDDGALDAIQAQLANMLPGESIATPIDLANVGTVDLDVTALLSAAGTGFELRLEIEDAEDCGAAPIAGPAVGTVTPYPLGMITHMTTVDLCVEVTATNLVLPEDDFDFDVTFTGTQVP